MPRWKYYPDLGPKMVAYMAKGLSNYEIAAKFKIDITTFMRWREDWPDFGECYKEGDTARKAFYTGEARRCWEEGKEKGFKYFSVIAGNELGFSESKSMTTNQININNLNILNNKSEPELLEILQTKLKNMNLPLLEADIIAEDKKDE